MRGSAGAALLRAVFPGLEELHGSAPLPTARPGTVGAPAAAVLPVPVGECLCLCPGPGDSAQQPCCPSAAAWQALCGLDVGEVKKMFLITASSCLASLHHSQLIKHFLLLSTHPRPASLPPAHRAPAPSWLLSLDPFLPPLSFTGHFPTRFPGFQGKPKPLVGGCPSYLLP